MKRYDWYAFDSLFLCLLVCLFVRLFACLFVCLFVGLVWFDLVWFGLLAGSFVCLFDSCCFRFVFASLIPLVKHVHGCGRLAFVWPLSVAKGFPFKVMKHLCELLTCCYQSTGPFST